MQTLIAGRFAIRVFVIPIAANIVRHFKLLIGNAEIFQPLGGGKTGTTGADNTNLHARGQRINHHHLPYVPRGWHNPAR